MRARRVIAGVAVWAGAGVVASYLVAWAFAAWLTPERFNVAKLPDLAPWRFEEAEPPELLPVPPWGGSPRYEELRRRGYIRARVWVGPGCRVVDLVDDFENFKLLEYRFGWPWPANRFTIVSGVGRTTVTSYNVPLGPHPRVWYGGVSIRPNATSPMEPNFRRLGLRPVWPGLLADSGVYGVGLAVLYHGGVAWRRRRRVGRGCCGVCGYPVRGLSVCPECGAEVAREAGRAGAGH